MAENHPICSVAGCGKGGKIVRGLCGTHYRRWQRHGDPLAGRYRAPNGEPQRYLSDVVLAHKSDECLIWPYARDGKGYAAVVIDGVTVVAPRMVCESVNGPPPTPEHETAHSCGRGHEGCINPGHLRWATREENQGDRIEHGAALVWHASVGAGNAEEQADADAAEIHAEDSRTDASWPVTSLLDWCGDHETAPVPAP